MITILNEKEWSKYPLGDGIESAIWASDVVMIIKKTGLDVCKDKLTNTFGLLSADEVLPFLTEIKNLSERK